VQITGLPLFTQIGKEHGALKMEKRPDISKFSDDESVSSSTGEEGSNRIDARDEVKEVHMLAQKETKAVLVWKLVVLMMLLVTSAMVCTGTYIILNKAEDTDYEDSVSIEPMWLVTLVHSKPRLTPLQYYLFANTIQDASQSNIQDIMLASRSLSKAITAEAVETNSYFPFVTVPMFEVYGETARVQSGFELIMFSPVVTKDNVPNWEEYSVANQGWMETSKSIFLGGDKRRSYGEDGALTASDYLEGDISPIIYEMDENGFHPLDSGDGPFTPIWQTSPPPFSPGLINVRLLVCF
jgi:hypothetical protein